MGIPWFQLKAMQFPEKVLTFSSNYELYASLSNRVMAHLEELSSLAAANRSVAQYAITKTNAAEHSHVTFP